MTQSFIEEIAITALKKAYQIHEELGVNGEEEIQKNQFGETALRADIECEKAVIDTFRKVNFPIKIKSEEHGLTDIGKKPIYFGVLDGLDGSKVYRKARGRGRYGTMFAIFSNLNPKYDDYLFSGVMEHSTKKLFFASKNKGSFVIINNQRLPIHCADISELNKEIKIYIDEPWDINREVFSKNLQGFNVVCLDSSAAHYTDLASGKVDLVLECTRKSNLEIAVTYGLITEAGGIMTTLDGIGLGQKKYLEFGQDKHVPIVTASTKQLAKMLIEHISQIG